MLKIVFGLVQKEINVRCVLGKMVSMRHEHHNIAIITLQSQCFSSRKHYFNKFMPF